MALPFQLCWLQKHFSPLGWFHSLSKALFGRCLTALAPPASWDLQGHPRHFFHHFMHRCSRSLCRDTSVPHLAAVTLPNSGRFHNSFTLLSFVTIKPEIHAELPSSVGYLECDLASSLNYICINFDLLLLFRIR